MLRVEKLQFPKRRVGWADVHTCTSIQENLERSAFETKEVINNSSM